jgi:hypothetical protein
MKNNKPTPPVDEVPALLRTLRPEVAEAIYRPTREGLFKSDRQGELLRGLVAKQQRVQLGADEIAEAILQKFRNSGVDVRAI